MKRIFFSAVLTMSVMVAAAQNSSSSNSGNRSANSKKSYLATVSTDDDIRQMAVQMRLNEAQYIRLRDLSRSKDQQMKEINNMYANDATMRQSKMQAVSQQFEKQLAQAVSESQFTAYLESQGRGPANNTGNNYQAAGYGGQSLESGAATGTSINGGAVNPSSDEMSKMADKTETRQNRKEKMKAEKEKRKMKNNKDKVKE